MEIKPNRVVRVGTVLVKSDAEGKLPTDIQAAAPLAATAEAPTGKKAAKPKPAVKK